MFAKPQMVSLREESKLEFGLGSSSQLNQFCLLKRNEKNSQCEAFYQNFFAENATQERSFIKCPYGLSCIGPLKWTENVRMVSGLLIEGNDCPPELAGFKGVSTKAQIQEYLDGYDAIAREFHQQSYGYLEAAIHDVRHLNADITVHAERLLKVLGYAENVEWDKAKLNAQETDKKTLSIYCASRDISAALSMHEIAIDTKRAADDVVPTNIHRLFYRQKQINLEKLEKKKLTVQLGSTPVSKKLTKSFSLVPIILLNNAIKYAESNSTIQINFVEAGSTFRIVCINTGPIVRKDELATVFLKHRRGSNRSGISGHGIGLWLATVILQANVGAIQMEVEETGRDLAGRKTGKTIVTVRLP